MKKLTEEEFKIISDSHKLRLKSGGIYGKKAEERTNQRRDRKKVG